MNLQQKSKKIKEIKQGMRKAALVGLASLVTTTALGKESKNDFGGDVKNNQTEIPITTERFFWEKAIFFVFASENQPLLLQKSITSAFKTVKKLF